MKRAFNRIVRNPVFWLITVFCLLALLIDIVAGQQQPRQSRSSRSYNPKIKIGEFPPDFELPRLTFTTDAAGKPIGIIKEKDTVRLSSFRGKRPVCLIMSSYT